MTSQQTTAKSMHEAGLRSPWADHILIAFARLESYVGITGTLGLLALILSSIYGASRIYAPKPQEKLAAAMTAVATVQQAEPAPATASSAMLAQQPSLPLSTESLALLKKIKKLTKSNGLAWSQAEYRITPITPDSLATLEISTSLKGPYLNLRQVLVELLDQEPALGLRELTLSRPNGDSSDVEAKIRWVVFLADGWPESPKGALHD